MKTPATNTTGRTKPRRSFLLIANEPLEPAALAAVMGLRADEETACDFALWKEQPNLKVTDERTIQPRYRMQ